MRLAAALALIGLAAPAVAADCPLSKAIYDQAETGYTLVFRPVMPEDGLSTSNVFDMTMPGSDKRVLGDVMWGNGFARPMGYLRFDCPDAYIEDDDLCIRWKGIVYGVTGGKADLLPPDVPVAEYGSQVLLPQATEERAQFPVNPAPALLDGGERREGVGIEQRVGEHAVPPREIEPLGAHHVDERAAHGSMTRPEVANEVLVRDLVEPKR